MTGARTTAPLTKKICIFLKTAPLAESRGGATSRVARFFQSQQQQLVALISLAVRGLNSDRHASSADN
jgi:hypothetical protein